MIKIGELEEAYQNQIEFRAIDAKSSEGQQAFRAFALPGHPGFTLIDAAGEVLWKGFGKQPRENIEINLRPELPK